MSRSKFRAGALLILTFAAGLAAGVAADRTWLLDQPAAAADAGDGSVRPQEGGETDGADGERHGKRDEKGDEKPYTVIERFADDLGLTQKQRAEIETILSHHRESMKEMWSEVRPRFRSLVDSARSQIESVLTPEQVQQYRKLLRREHRRDDHRGGSRNDSSQKDGSR